MDSTKTVTDVLLYFIPALLVMMGMYLVIKKSMDAHLLTLRKFLEKEMHMKSAEDKTQKARETLPIKLQAYERMILFLERIAPNSILVRVHRGGMAASQLQADLVATIRAEFEHNISQQIYVSEAAWDEVKAAKEDMIRIINNAFSHVGNNASGIQMSSQIYEQVLKMEMLPTQKAIDFLKSEAKKMVG